MGWRGGAKDVRVELARALDLALRAASQPKLEQQLAERVAAWEVGRRLLADSRALPELLDALVPPHRDLYADARCLDRLLCMHLANLIDEEAPEAELAAAYAFAWAGRNGRAIEVTESVLEAGPNDLAARELLATLWCRADNSRRARDAARAVVAVDPENLAASIIIAKSEPDRAQAVGMLTRIIARNGASSAVLWERARAFAEVGNYLGASADIDHALELAPVESLLLVEKMNLAHGQQRWADYRSAAAPATAVVDRWLKVAPRDWYLRYNKIGLTWATNGFERALDEANRFVADRPDVSISWSQRAGMHGAARNHGLAVRDYDRAAELQPHAPQLLLGRGVARAHIGEFEAALKDILAAEAIDPECARHMHAAAGANFRLGRREAGRRLVAQALSDHPNESGVLYNIAWDTAEFGDGSLALSLLEAALANADDSVGMARHARFDPGWSRVRSDPATASRFREIVPSPGAWQRFRELLLRLSGIPAGRRALVAAAVAFGVVLLVTLASRL